MDTGAAPVPLRRSPVSLLSEVQLIHEKTGASGCQCKGSRFQGFAGSGTWQNRSLLCAHSMVLANADHPLGWAGLLLTRQTELRSMLEVMFSSFETFPVSPESSFLSVSALTNGKKWMEEEEPRIKRKTKELNCSLLQRILKRRGALLSS